jgi:hypothetical protein
LDVAPGGYEERRKQRSEIVALLQSEWMVLGSSASDFREHAGQDLEAQVLLVS